MNYRYGRGPWVGKTQNDDQKRESMREPQWREGSSADSLVRRSPSSLGLDSCFLLSSLRLGVPRPGSSYFICSQTENAETPRNPPLSRPYNPHVEPLCMPFERLRMPRPLTCHSSGSAWHSSRSACHSSDSEGRATGSTWHSSGSPCHARLDADRHRARPPQSFNMASTAPGGTGARPRAQTKCNRGGAEAAVNGRGGKRLSTNEHECTRIRSGAQQRQRWCHADAFDFHSR